MENRTSEHYWTHQSIIWARKVYLIGIKASRETLTMTNFDLNSAIKFAEWAKRNELYYKEQKRLASELDRQI